MDNEQRKEIEKELWAWGSALKDCERRRREIKRLLEQAADAENVLHSQIITGIPHGTDVGDPTGKAVIMRDNTLRRIAQLTDEINAIMQRKERMDELISRLPENMQSLLEMRHVRGWRMSIEIPMHTYITRQSAHRWYNAALEMLLHYVTKDGVE